MYKNKWRIALAVAVLALLMALAGGCAGDYTLAPGTVPVDTTGDGVADAVAVDADGDGVPDSDPTGRPILHAAETAKLKASQKSDVWENMAVGLLALVGAGGGWVGLGAAGKLLIRTWRENKNTERLVEKSKVVLADVVTTVEQAKIETRKKWAEVQAALKSGNIVEAQRLVAEAQALFDAAMQAQMPDTQEAVGEVRERLPKP